MFNKETICECKFPIIRTQMWLTLFGCKAGPHPLISLSCVHNGMDSDWTFTVNEAFTTTEFESQYLLCLALSDLSLAFHSFFCSFASGSHDYKTVISVFQVSVHTNCELYGKYWQGIGISFNRPRVEFQLIFKLLFGSVKHCAIVSAVRLDGCSNRAPASVSTNPAFNDLICSMIYRTLHTPLTVAETWTLFILNIT